MKDAKKPIHRRELEARVEEAKAEVDSIYQELNEFSKGGLEAAFDVLQKVSNKLSRCQSPQEKQKLREEYARLDNDPLIVQYFATTVRLAKAQERYDSAVKALEDLSAILGAGDAPSTAPVTDVPLSETKRTLQPQNR